MVDLLFVWFVSTIIVLHAHGEWDAPNSPKRRCGDKEMARDRHIARNTMNYLHQIDKNLGVGTGIS